MKKKMKMNKIKSMNKVEKFKNFKSFNDNLRRNKTFKCKNN